jgi:exonuclease III
LDDAKLSLHTPWEGDEAYTGSILFFSETRRNDEASRWFPGYTVYTQLAEKCKAGQGLLLAVPLHELYHPEAVHIGDDIIAVVLRDVTGCPLALIIGVYIPPKNSPRLRAVSLPERYARVQDIISQHADVPVIVVGDLNCKCPSYDTSPHAQALHLFTTETSLRVCTHAPGIDMNLLSTPAPDPSLMATAPSFFPRNSASQPSRIDHILACPRMWDMKLCTWVLSDEHGFSDHRPLLASFSVTPAPAMAPSGRCAARPRCLVWRFARQQQYAAALLCDHDVLLSGMTNALHSGDVDVALSHLLRTVQSAAARAGMSLARDRRSKASLPYMTAELRQLRCDYWRAFRQRDVVEYLRLRALYQHAVRFKKRMWLRHRCRSVLSKLKGDPRTVFKAYTGSRPSLPLPLSHPAHWSGWLRDLTCPSAAPPTPTTPTVGPVSEHLLQVAVALNAAFTVDEVAQALKRLNNHKSPGFGGICSEFFRYAVFQPPPIDGQRQPPVHVLVECITELMNAVFTKGVVPGQWDLSLITPVYKRGSPLSTANYRPIAVGEPLARLYAVLLQLRLDSYLEENRLLSDSQAGFRRKLSTCHQLFLLQHLIDKHKRRKEPLYAGFVDLKSAYDLVVRDVLWVCVQQKGIHGQFLGAIQSLYTSPLYAVCVNGVVGASMPSTIGVRQGCPLSPSLFGLILDALNAVLVREAGPHAPALDGFSPVLVPTAGNLPRYPARPITNIDFADDILLLSRNKRGMAMLLLALWSFCRDRGMLVSAPKTFLVQLVAGQAGIDVQHATSIGHDPPMRYGDRELRFELHGAKYLGLFVAPKRGVRSAPVDLCQRAHAAYMAFRRRLPNLDCEASINLSIRLYVQLVRPVMLYGSEVWAVLPGGATDRKSLHTAFHRHISALAGVPISAPILPLFMAMRLLSLQQEASLRAVRFWCSLWALPPTAFFRHVVFDNWRDACCYGVRNFAHGMHELLRDHNFALSTELCRPPLVPATDFLQRILELRDNDLAAYVADPRQAPSEGVQTCTYVRYHHLLPHEPIMPLYHLPLSDKACKILLCFMLGHSYLPVHLGRRTQVPRIERRCTLCTLPAVGDEHHMIFDCPALTDLRVERAALFIMFRRPAACHVSHFMRHKDRFAVAGFLLNALRRYKLVSDPSVIS